MLAAGEPSIPYEHQVVIDGKVFWQRWQDYPLFDDNGVVQEFQSVGYDITDLRLAQARAQENEQRLDFLLSETPAVIYSYCIQDDQPHLTYLSANVVSILGLSSEYFMEDTSRWYSCVHPADAPNLQGKLAGGDSYDEYRFRDKDGCYHWLADQQRGVSGKDGQIVMIGAWWDITDRKAIERTVQESENRLHAAVRGTGAGIWDWDMVADRVTFSRQWRTMLGYEEHEIPNSFSAWQQLWHPDDAEMIEQAVEDHLLGKTDTYEVIHRLRHKSGDWRWIMTRGELQRARDGKPLRWIGTNIDVTDQKRSEEELRKQSGLIQSLLESIPDIIFYKDVEGVYLGCNPAFAEFVGLSSEQIIGKTDYDLFDKDIADFFRQHDQRMLELDKPRHNEERIGNLKPLDRQNRPTLAKNRKICQQTVGETCCK